MYVSFTSCKLAAEINVVCVVQLPFTLYSSNTFLTHSYGKEAIPLKTNLFYFLIVTFVPTFLLAFPQ